MASDFPLKKKAADLNVLAAEAQHAVNQSGKKEKLKKPKVFSDEKGKLINTIGELEAEIKVLKEVHIPPTAVLSPTEFELKQSLVELSLEINTTRNTLNELKENKSEFIEKQKAKTLYEIQTVHEKSREYLSESTKNLDEIVKFINDVKEIRESTELLMKDHKEDVTEFSSLSLKVSKEIQENLVILNTKSDEIMKQRKEIVSQKKFISKEKIQIENEKKLIESRQQSLKIAYETLKKKKYGR